jgi:hypothetical protein
MIRRKFLSSDDEVTGEIVFEDYVHSSYKDTSSLSKCFGSESKVLKCHLNLLLLELFKALSQK